MKSYRGGYNKSYYNKGYNKNYSYNYYYQNKSGKGPYSNKKKSNYYQSYRDNQETNTEQEITKTQFPNQPINNPIQKTKYQKRTYPKIDQFTAQMMLYRADMYILLRYPHLIDINEKGAQLMPNISEDSNFFIIKSFSEEDIHKAIKYNVWTSTKKGNQTLNNAFKRCKEKNSSVYLIFSSNRSVRLILIYLNINAIKLGQILWSSKNGKRNQR